MTGVRLIDLAESETREQLQILGLAFRLDELWLSKVVCREIGKRAKALAKHVRYVEPMPKGCAVYIHEMAWGPDLGDWINGYEKVEKPYWFPKMLLNDLRDLQNDLDDLLKLKLAKEAGWGPDLNFHGGEI